MTSRTTDIYCDDCNEYLYSVYSSDNILDNVYCDKCQSKRETPLEYFIRKLEEESKWKL